MSVYRVQTNAGIFNIDGTAPCVYPVASGGFSSLPMIWKLSYALKVDGNFLLFTSDGTSLGTIVLPGPVTTLDTIKQPGDGALVFIVDPDNAEHWISGGVLATLAGSDGNLLYETSGGVGGSPSYIICAPL